MLLMPNFIISVISFCFLLLVTPNPNWSPCIGPKFYYFSEFTIHPLLHSSIYVLCSGCLK